MIKYLFSFLILVGSVHADLKLDYVDSANEKGTVTFSPGGPATKRWVWTRDGVIILKRTAKSISGRDSLIDQVIYHGDTKIFLSLLVDKNSSEIFYPQSAIKLLRSDADRDGRFDSISLTDTKDALIELYSIDQDGLIVPASDKELKERQEFLKSYSKGMKDF